MDQNNERAREGTAPAQCPECGATLVGAWCAFCGWSPEEEKVTLGEIRQIAFELREQEGGLDPDRARRLLEAFCDSVDRGKAPPAEMMAHLNTAFRAYLGGKDLEAALGLTRRAGAPSAVGLHQGMAMRVLERRLAGLSYRAAVTSTAPEPGAIREESVVKAAWAKHKGDALLALRLRRAVSDKEWMPDELARLKRIFPKDTFVDACPVCGSLKFTGSCPTCCPFKSRPEKF
jgi:hypothetical protein